MAYSAGSAVLTLEVDYSKLKSAIKQTLNELKPLRDEMKKLKMDLGIKQVRREIQTLRKDLTSARSEIKKQETSYSKMRSDIKNINSDLEKQKNLSKEIKNNISNTTNGVVTQDISQSQYDTLTNSRITNSTANQHNFQEGINNATKTMSSISQVGSIIKSVIVPGLTAITTTISLTTVTMKAFTNTFNNALKNVSSFIVKYSGIKTVSKGIKNAITSIGDAITAAFSIDNIRQFIEECTEAGSKLVEVQNVIDSVFETNAGNINSWATNAIKQYGMAETTAKQFAGTLGGMLNSAGLNSDQVEVMSQNLASLAADLASFYNLDYDQAFSKIRAGMAGQVRPLQELGVSLSVANLQQYMYAQGINEVYQNLDYASKEIIRYNYLMQQTTKAQGDYAKTFYTWANQIRYLQQNFTELKTVLGSILTQVLNPILIMLNAIMQEMIAVATQAKNLVAEILGIDALSNTTQSATDLADLFTDMEGSASETADAVKRTVSSFDELHQLSNQKDSSSAMSEISLELPGISTNETPKPNENKYYKYILDLIDLIKKSWKNADFTDIGRGLSQKISEGINWLNDNWETVTTLTTKISKSLATALNGIMEGINWRNAFTLSSNIGDTLAANINTAIKTINWRNVGTTFINAVKSFELVLAGLLKKVNFDAVGIAFAETLAGVFSIDDTTGGTFLNILTDNISKGISGINKIISSFSDMMKKGADAVGNDGKNNILLNPWTTFGMAIDQWTSIGLKLADAFNGLFSTGALANLGTSLKNLGIGILKILSTTFKNIKWEDVGTSLGEIINNLFSPDENGNTFLNSIGTVVIDIINGLITALSNTLTTADIENIKAQLSNLLKRLGNEIKWDELFNDIDKVKGVIETFLIGVINSIPWTNVIALVADLISNVLVTGITTIGAGLVALVMGVVDLICTAYSEIVGACYGISISLLELFGIAWDSIKTGFSEVWNFIKNIWEGAPDWFKNLISDINIVFTNIGEKIGISFSDALKTPINAVLSVIESIVNGFIDSINNVSNIIGKFTNNSYTTFDHINIPMLAQGGYLRANTPQLIVAGDNKREGEIVAPESKIQENTMIALQNFFGGSFVNQLAGAIGVAIAGAGAANGNINITLQVGEQELTSVLLNAQNLNNARGGR